MEHHQMAHHHILLPLAVKFNVETIFLPEKKSASDSWKTIKGIKNDNDIQNDKERMTHACIKRGTMIKYTKDKKKGIWLTARAMHHDKNFTNSF